MTWSFTNWQCKASSFRIKVNDSLFDLPFRQAIHHAYPHWVIYLATLTENTCLHCSPRKHILIFHFSELHLKRGMSTVSSKSTTFYPHNFSWFNPLWTPYLLHYLEVYSFCYPFTASKKCILHVLCVRMRWFPTTLLLGIFQHNNYTDCS